MELCRGCGADLSSDDRFCSHCGQATASEFEILGADPPVSTQQVVGRGGRPKGPAVALLALGALAGLVWLVSAWASADDDRPEADELADADDAAESTTSSTARSSSTTERSTTSAADSGPTTSTSQVADGPLLGRETGFSVLVGGPRLRRIDLDTGLVTGFERRGVPILESGGWLLLAESTSEGLFAVPTADPDQGERIDVPGVRFGPSGSYESEPGVVWVPDFEGDEFSMNEVELSTGTIVDQEDASTPWFIGRSGAADLTVAPDGGVFERSAEGYRQVTDSGFVAANNDFILLNECSDPVSCSLRWVDRNTGQPVDRPVPANPGQFYGGTLSDGGRVLTLWGTSEPMVFDVDRGEFIDLGIVDYVENVTVSPDERYAAVIDGRPTIVDLDTGETVEIDITSTGYSEILFVETP